MKQEILKKLQSLSGSIEKASLESVKAQSYADGYLDCVRDIISGENVEFSKILEIKFDGKSKTEAYSDITKVVLEMIKYVEQQPEHKNASDDNEFGVHPNDRAQKFLERINKETGR